MSENLFQRCDGFFSLSRRPYDQVSTYRRWFIDVYATRPIYTNYTSFTIILTARVSQLKDD